VKSSPGVNKRRLSLVDWAKLIGFLLVVAATIISTVVIPSKDRKVSELQRDILDFRDSRALGAISMLHYGGQRIFRRIELFEANQLVGSSQDRQSIDLLRSRALTQTATMAGEWATLFGGDEAERTREESEKKVDQIIHDGDLPFGEKLSQVENIWNDNIGKASQRLAAAHEQYQKQKSKKEEVERARLFWASVFAWLQISGLVLFSGAEVFGKIAQGKTIIR
jgi:hypothetical protein